MAQDSCPYALDSRSAQPIGAAFLQTVGDMLDAIFGLPFEYWTPGEPWKPYTGDGRDASHHAASDALTHLLEQSRSATDPVVFDSPGQTPMLAVPIHRKRRLLLVAIASLSRVTPELTRLCRAFSREMRLREQLEEQMAAGEAYAIEVTRAFEELYVLRQLAAHLDLTDVSQPSTALAEATMGLLHTSLATDCAVWVAPQDTRRPKTPDVVDPTPDYTIVASAGTFDPRGVRSAVARYGNLAARQPVVKNGLEGTDEGALMPGVRKFVLAKIVAGDRHFGWIMIVNRSDAQHWGSHEACLSHEEFGSVEAGLVSTVASILATHARNLALFQEKEDTFVAAVRALVSAIEAKDPYTRGHSERVGLFAYRLGEQLGLERSICRQLYLSGLVHDVGKIAIRGATLRKPGRLSDQEFEHIQEHPERGWDILYDLDRLQYVLPGVVHHHERFDGLGYPDGLAGDDIPLSARILAVADTYDALTSDRPYRNGMEEEKAESILRGGAGTQWDPAIIDAMLAAIPDMIGIRHAYQPKRPPKRNRSAPLDTASERTDGETAEAPGGGAPLVGVAAEAEGG